jgi:arylsulfatase A-like enzyme
VPRPNVVLVFMDDWTHWALTSGQVHTPNLDRLAARGTTFTHAVNQGSWTGAVCVAARAMLVSGRSLFHAEAAVEDGSDSPLLGEAFGAAGYRTYFTGKWHNPPGALRRGYREVGPHAGAMLAPARLADGSRDVGRPAPGNTWDPTDPAGAGHWMRVDGRVVHSSQRWVDAALGFLDSAAGGPDPFFLHVALHAPHDPRQAPARWLDRYPAEHVRIPPNALLEHPFDQGDRYIRDELLAPFPRTPDAVRLHRREYFAIASHADEQIGRLLDALQRRRRTDDTVVVFSGDHGLALGEHGLMGKQSLYDHSVRVPLVLAGPGVAAGARDDRLAYQASIFATLCALTGVPAPATLEFPSLTAPAADEPLFLAYRHLQRGVRTRRWALLAYAPARRVQLFDVAADPWQTRDLAGEPAHDGTVRELLAVLRRRQAELDDPSGGWTAGIDDAWRHAREEVAGRA